MRLMLALLPFGLLAPLPALAAPLVCALDATVDRAPSMVGDALLKPVFDLVLPLYRAENGDVQSPARWEFGDGARAIGALMFDLADVVAVTRPFAPAELAPYEHQFHGDMIKEPLVITFGSVDGRPAMLAVNRRPGSPLAPRIVDFVGFVLGQRAQAALARVPGFVSLPPERAAAERAKLDGFLAAIDRHNGSSSS